MVLGGGRFQSGAERPDCGAFGPMVVATPPARCWSSGQSRADLQVRQALRSLAVLAAHSTWLGVVGVGGELEHAHARRRTARCARIHERTVATGARGRPGSGGPSPPGPGPGTSNGGEMATKGPCRATQHDSWWEQPTRRRRRGACQQPVHGRPPCLCGRAGRAGLVWSLGNLTDPLPDPYLAVAELLILLMAPVMVVLMASVHACAPVHLRMFSMIAFGWMLVAACLTMTVHVVELVVARRVDPGAVPGFARLFGFAWPSMLYAVDVVAWDLMLGLSLLCAAFVFTGHRYRAVRRGLMVSAALCLVGLVGPATDVLAWRGIGILGYVVAFPVTCLWLSRAFSP